MNWWQKLKLGGGLAATMAIATIDPPECWEQAIARNKSAREVINTPDHRGYSPEVEEFFIDAAIRYNAVASDKAAQSDEDYRDDYIELLQSQQELLEALESHLSEIDPALKPKTQANIASLNKDMAIIRAKLRSFNKEEF